ncbi:glycerol uptake protein 1 [Metschnikowia bicuspidata var. bicuspidata NRRL YB-4993]|uniref:Glycerol uptake protein 1 n=1 Tax=Metschnikowia bicuspidata var. bicuspidata NRRL YB-4993 TaxID=869754 RepID=A0A1A0H4U1_9ASCO|nr:glycerol uptake protein 1 [Metschnikowia bicuspidata var. bicuspidata NRRL YB-4993]OBA18943.1 glycerol uptake protein 1 [Metschnikowia bicuspidata var. bicuspidata NRRL YB-4993]
MYQSNYHPALSTKDLKRILVYGARLMFCVLVMEFLLHFMYVVAVSKTKAWEGDTPFQLSMLGMFNLNIIWLKLLIPWRLFRFWSLLDGIDPPENMIRCMDNNYSAVSFWRSWHRSFNKWVLRYIYIPMGGAGAGTGGYTSRVVNSLVVFSFVAIWHDIELKLLMWGWLVVLFLLPEIFATSYFKRYSNNSWYRHLCAIGAVVNIWMMMIANLYGFCLGHDGTIALLRAFFGTSNGLIYLVLSSGALFVGAQVMFEIREAEKRRGVDVKC